MTKESIKEYHKRWRDNNPDKVSKYTEKTTKWIKDNPEKFNKNCSNWRKNNKAKWNSICKRYADKSKGRCNEKLPYTTEDVELILSKRFSDPEIALMLNRSVQSIVNKRYSEKKKLKRNE